MGGEQGKEKVPIEGVKEVSAHTCLKLGKGLRAGDKNEQASGNGLVSKNRKRKSQLQNWIEREPCPE